MIKSMTGYGRSEFGNGEHNLEVQIRSVNSRYLDIKFKGFPIELSIENEIKKMLSDNLQRGSIQIRLEQNQNQKNQKISFNKERFDLIQKILKNIHVKHGQKINLGDIISTHDLLITDEVEPINQKFIMKATQIAINQLNEMRVKEGELIFLDLSKRIKMLYNGIDTIEQISKQYKEEKKLKLHSTILELLEKKLIDENRLIQEVAYLSERADVTEEIVRCRSHFDQINSYINYNDPVGKRINFLIQEIGREVNTIGSKSHQIEITTLVVEMKDELEKIREQIQNIL